MSVPLVGSAGGTIDGPAGTSLRIPVGAVTNSAPIALASLESTDFGVMPLGLSFIQGVQVTLADALARGASLAVPRPGRRDEREWVLLVRLESIAGSTRLVLAGVVRIEGGQLVSDTIVAGQQTALLGVRDAGRYAFVRSEAPLGFAGGLVKGVDAAPFAGALVTSAGFGVCLPVESGRCVSRRCACWCGVVDRDRSHQERCGHGLYLPHRPRQCCRLRCSSPCSRHGSRR